MAPSVSISALLAAPRADALAVALSAGQSQDWACLKRDVSNLAGRIASHGGGRWLVVSEGAYALAVGLLATLHAGGTPYLPANLQVGHLQTLAEGIDGALMGPGPLPDLPSAHAILEDQPSRSAPELAAFDGEAATVILHTSGSTGWPKALHKPLRCLEAEVAVLEERFGSRLAGPILATVPPYHIYGLLFRVLWPLSSGRPFARDTIRFPGELSAALEAFPGSTLISSPAFLSRALAVLDLPHLSDRLGRVFSSGSPLPREVALAYAARLDQPIVEVYGSTETGGIAYRSAHEDEPTSPWTPLPGVTLSLSKDGCMAVKSPFLAEPGWSETADLAVLLSDGRFLLKGRSDDVVKLEERRISLTEIEQRLARSVEVEAARVVPLVDAKGKRTILGAVVVPSEAGWKALEARGKRAFSDQLWQMLRPFVERLARPRKWRFVRRLPQSAQGKVTKAALASLFPDGRGSEQRPRILQRDHVGDELQLQLALDPGLVFFDGHFEVAPILPGIAQLDWAVRFSREAFDITANPHRIEALKFFRVLPAGAEVTLDLRYDRDRTRLSFRYHRGDQEHSSGRIVFDACP